MRSYYDGGEDVIRIHNWLISSFSSPYFISFLFFSFICNPFHYPCNFCFIYSTHFISFTPSHLISPHHLSAYLISSYLNSVCLISSYLNSACLIGSYLNSSCLISSPLNSACLLSSPLIQKLSSSLFIFSYLVRSNLNMYYFTYLIKSNLIKSNPLTSLQISSYFISYHLILSHSITFPP